MHHQHSFVHSFIHSFIHEASMCFRQAGRVVVVVMVMVVVMGLFSLTLRNISYGQRGISSPVGSDLCLLYGGWS